MKLDHWDVCVIVGALLIAVALYFVWPLAPLFWLGAVLMLAGILGAR
jgi:hypothetical protein